jgi:hypothetical protein
LKTSLIILLLVNGFSTFGQKRLKGFYSSKKPELGFFVTRIQLNQDSTFKYEFGGDLAYDKGTGKYWCEKGDLILLKFDEVKLDSVQKIMQAPQGGGPSGRPKGFIYANGKLFSVDNLGEKRGKAYLKKRRGHELKFRGENGSR